MLWSQTVTVHMYISFITQFEMTTLLKTKLRGFGGLEVAGSHPAEAVGFLGRKSPQHAFLRRGK